MLERNGYNWEKTEDVYVKKNYIILSDEQMGKHLRRTTYSVLQRRYKLNAIRARKRRIPESMLVIANLERDKMISLNNKVTRMRELIAMAEKETNNFKLDKYKKELKKLSGL